jgi:hypothetical protein
MSEERSDVHLRSLSAEQLAAEARAAGLALADEIAVPESEDHIGSVVAVLEAR